MSVFMCGKKTSMPCSVVGCQNDAESVCIYPLRGPKAGQICERPLCAKHAANLEGFRGAVCPPHAKVAK